MNSPQPWRSLTHYRMPRATSSVIGAMPQTRFGKPYGTGVTPGYSDKTQRAAGRLPQMGLSAPTSRRKAVGTSQGVEGGRHTIRKNRHILHGRHLHRRNRRSSQDLTGPNWQVMMFRKSLAVKV